MLGLYPMYNMCRVEDYVAIPVHDAYTLWPIEDMFYEGVGRAQ